jgi:hypothetical protein
MHRHRFEALGTATIVAVLGLSGCSAPSSPPPLASASLTGALAQLATPTPPPEVLADVLYRLADPQVRGTDKLTLVEGATADSAAVLDRFATALFDGGYAPVTFDVRDIAWSERDPANVVATIAATTPNPGVAGFSFPLEFKRYQGGWQLSQRTADMLLAFGTERAGPVPTPSR